LSTVLASPANGDSGGSIADDGGCNNILPPPLPPDQNCQGKYCKTNPVDDANAMGIILGILDKNCLMQGLRNALASGETPNEPDNGYGTIVKGTVTSAPPQYSNLIGQTNVHLDPWTLSTHPGIHVHFGKGSGSDSYSTAAGRYQILQRYAPTPFYPPNQDAYANSELKSVGARTDAMNGDFTAAMADAGTRWQSMPGSNLGGKQIPLANAANAFLQGISGCQAH
jgi:muramidase (phage lysozyme)